MREWAYPARVEELSVERAATVPARRAPGGAAPRVQGYREATLLVAEVVGLAGLARAAGAERLVAILDQLFRVADKAAVRRRLSRVAATGGYYTVASGVPSARIDHVEAAADLAIDMVRAAASIGSGLSLRIGLHTGPVVAALEGPEGVREVWGESIRIAERMVAQGVPGLVQVSGAAASRLAPRYRLESRPDLPGARPLDAWFLMGRRGA